MTKICKLSKMFFFFPKKFFAWQPIKNSKDRVLCLQFEEEPLYLPSQSVSGFQVHLKTLVLLVSILQEATTDKSR